MNLRRRLAGALGLLAILAVVIGMPLVLLAVGANPLASGLPSLDAIKTALTAPDDGSLVVTLFQVVGWLSWAFLTLSILVEAVSRARGVRAPRLPGLQLPQTAARGLVGTAMLLFVTVPLGVTSATAATAVPAHAATAATAAAVAAPAAPSAAAPSVAAPAALQESHAPAAPPVTKHEVQQGDTLWSIAERQLGDGHRFREIVALNPTLLSEGPDFLGVGWVLDIPAISTPTPATGKTIQVREGDTLSGIAQRHLGDPDRYPEIVEASRDIRQPGGAHLSDPDELQPGWTLRLPAAATKATANPSGTTRTEHPSSQSRHQDATPAPSVPTLDEAPTPAPELPELPPLPDVVPAPSVAPSPAATTGPGLVEQAAPEGEAVTAGEHLGEDSDWVARTSYGVGALLAAGVLTLVGSRRRTQQRLRRPGQRIPLPEGRTAEVEQELRAAADNLSVEVVDIALRGLARHCAAAGVPLPAVRAARLTATQFDLYLAEPAQLPDPWADTAGSTVWTLDLASTVHLDDETIDDVPAPYPALVTLGHDDEDGHVFLDLEYIGSLGVIGDPTATREILAALAVELATSTWADDLQVTVVGAFAELEDTLQTGRIRYLPSVGRILDDLHRRAADDRRALAQEHAGDLHTARVTGAAPDAWSPEIVLLAGDITDRQRNQLQQLVDELPRVAIAVVTAGAAVGQWSLDLTAGLTTEAAELAPIGLQLRPQRLPSEQYGHLLEIAALTDIEELDGQPQPEPTVADVEAVTPVDDAASAAEPASAGAMDAGDPQTSPLRHDPLPPTHDEEPASGVFLPEAARITTDAPSDTVDADPAHLSNTPTTHDEAPVHPLPLPAPKILVLGPVDMLHAAGKVEPTKRARLLEYAAYLALHPGATHTAIDDAIWPDRTSEDNLNTRNPATSKLRRWVGLNPDGEDYLPRHQAGEGYAFLPSVTTDVDDWRQLLGPDPFSAATEDLDAALQLVRGIPFEGTHRRRYAWAQPLKQRLISEIVDAAYELGRRRLMEGRWRAAEQALVVGLRIEPAQESLWRLRILAAHESRNPAAEAEAIERLLTITEQLECGLEDETEKLLAALKRPGTGLDQLLATAL